VRIRECNIFRHPSLPLTMVLCQVIARKMNYVVIDRLESSPLPSMCKSFFYFLKFALSSLVYLCLIGALSSTNVQGSGEKDLCPFLS
jgi:hypothetical protein